MDGQARGQCGIRRMKIRRGIRSRPPMMEKTQQRFCTMHGTSDPHVTVWKEDITFEERDGSYKVTDENIRFLDYIVSGTEFDEAYPQINGTPMDYTVNGMYDALVMNSLLSSSMLYQNLKDPVLAAKYLLNLLDNENKVQVEALQDGSKEGINIKITFIEDGAERFVKMIQPDSEDGIWIPQDYE